ncbi:Hypothetical protein P9303_23981 [Prochlorococcus marinus str. MIT 9303]|uniref:Uncharacterized protein n=2 Tax=Prochlorococcus marinus TaxID=1219 RepID=A2CCC1_PROM3|nr:Hypothetical protein P9303_23981 [Prochlorococcus marinus str. MIT 9303]
MQQLQSAVQAYQGRDLDDAEAIFKQILAVNPKEPTALHLLGCIYKDRGQLQQAVELIQASIREDESNPIPFFNLGKILAIAGQHENAVGVFQESLKRNQQIPETWFCFANALREIGKTEEAKRAYRNALQLNPAHAGAAGNLGALLTDDGELDEAEKVLRRALASNPEDINCLVNLGILLKEEGEFEEAIASYRKAIEVKPDFEDAYFNLGLLLKEVEGKVEEASVFFQKAIAIYRKAIEVKPDSGQAYVNLVTVLNKDGRLDEARVAIECLLSLKPPDDRQSLDFSCGQLVLDWYRIRVNGLFWDVELKGFLASNSHLSAVRSTDAMCFPPLFLKDGKEDACRREFYEKGFVTQRGVISGSDCAALVDELPGIGLMSERLIQIVLERNILRSVVKSAFELSGFPHLIWNCICFAKGPDDKAHSDDWHLDNHYNIWTSKLIVYLNSQSDELGATELVEASLSKELSEKSDYTGLVTDRDFYIQCLSGLVDELGLEAESLDPPHYTFSPDEAGTGVWFCPARVLHRGVSPKKGLRHVLTFSLTPLPRDCQWSMEQCVEKSVEILRDKIKQGMEEIDINPFWSVSNRSV